MTRRILTADDVSTLPDGATLVLSDGSTLTAAARELARRRNIHVVDDAAGASDGAASGAAPGASSASGDVLARTADAPSGVRSAQAGTAFDHGGRAGRIIATAVGVNRPGILSEVTAAIGQLGGDILEISQRITSGYFHAILIIDVAASGRSFAAFRDALAELSEPADYVVTTIDERVFQAMHRI